LYCGAPGTASALIFALPSAPHRMLVQRATQPLAVFVVFDTRASSSRLHLAEQLIVSRIEAVLVAVTVK